MNTIYIPQTYISKLSLYDTQSAIGIIKSVFQRVLCTALNLKRVSAPLFLAPGSGLNDDLNGIERPVSFDIPAIGLNGVVVHSLAKWKRMALYQYDFNAGNGLYTDMNAIRRDEELDNLHSIYVDQWDWEKVITPEMRNESFLRETVVAIVTCICHTLDAVRIQYPAIDVSIVRNVTFVDSQELEDLYPTLSPEGREYEVTKEYGTVFIQRIGGLLKSGKPHGLRAPDYDDWDLNGDLFIFHETLDCAMEISSMGIRVSPSVLTAQLKACGCENRAQLPFHKMLLDGKLPLTIGGGIGQSRLCMLLLGKAHIGEVQSSLWDTETYRYAKRAGVFLL